MRKVRNNCNRPFACIIDAIFVTEYMGNMYHTTLGEYEFDDDSRFFVKSVESMLSEYSDYEI